ncbi:MAG: hypothetical protein ACLVB5_05740 [Christensenellales bacterium]
MADKAQFYSEILPSALTIMLSAFALIIRSMQLAENEVLNALIFDRIDLFAKRE